MAKILTNAGEREMLVRDCVGMRAKLLCSATNNYATIAAGTEVVIHELYGTGQCFNIRTDECPRCGVIVYMRRVPRHDLELIVTPSTRIDDQDVSVRFAILCEKAGIATLEALAQRGEYQLKQLGFTAKMLKEARALLAGRKT